MQEINERINQIFAETGLKKIEIAAKLSVSPAFVTELCSGKKQPSARTAADICRVFDVNPRWLDTGEGDPYKEKDPSNTLSLFFGEVLRSAPDERSAFIAALAGLPAEFWPMVAELAREFVERLKAEKKDTEP